MYPHTYIYISTKHQCVHLSNDWFKPLAFGTLRAISRRQVSKASFQEALRLAMDVARLPPPC